jgi:hypothetical protein
MLLNIFMFELNDAITGMCGMDAYSSYFHFIYDICIVYINQTQRLPGLRFHSLTCTLNSQVQI